MTHRASSPDIGPWSLISCLAQRDSVMRDTLSVSRMTLSNVLSIDTDHLNRYRTLRTQGLLDDDSALAHRGSRR